VSVIQYIPAHIVLLLLFHCLPVQHTAQCNAEISITGEFTALYASALAVGVLIVLAAEAETCRTLCSRTQEKCSCDRPTSFPSLISYISTGVTYRLYISCKFLFRHAPFCVSYLENGNLGNAFLLPSVLITFHRRAWDDELHRLSRPHNCRKYFLTHDIPLTLKY
jgi:hypothetical protein